MISSNWLTKGIIPVLLGLSLVACASGGTESTAPTTASVAPTVAPGTLMPAASPSPNTDVGTGAVLDYADADRVLFHGYFGIFLYSIPDKKIIDSLDFRQFGDNVQGSNPVFVFMDKSLKHILVQESDGQGYRYSIETKSVEKLDNQAMKVALEQAITDAKARPGEISWDGDALVVNLTYSNNDRVIHLFR